MNTPSTPSSVLATKSVLPAIGFVLLASLLFTGTNTQAKILGETLPIAEVVWTRFVSHLLVVFIIVRGRITETLRTERPAVHWARSTMMCIGVGCYFTGFIYMPLAEAGAVLQLAPMMVMALSVVFLGERVGIRRWSGVFFAFIGALVVIRPGLGGFGLEVLWPLAGAVFYAVYQILTRVLKTADSAMTALCYAGLVGAVVSSCIVPFYWTTLTGTELIFMLGIGFTGAMGHLALIQAYRMIDASLISPFMYFILVWMTASGILIFDHVPDGLTLFGIAMIILSGAYVAYREHAVSKAVTHHQPVPS